MRRLIEWVKMPALTALVIFLSGVYSYAMMGNPGWSNMPGGPGMQGSQMMSNTGGFGMMNGMAGTPVVGEDGTAYLTSFVPAASPGTVPSSASFQSTILAVTVTGEVTSIALKGIVSRPVVAGNVLVATASLPDFTNFNIVGSFGINPANAQSVIYVLPLPFTSSTVPVAVSLDGSFASAPVIAANHIYVTATDFGNAMMGTTGTWAYGSHNFNASGTAKTWLYIFNLDGTLASKTVLQ